MITRINKQNSENSKIKKREKSKKKSSKTKKYVEDIGDNQVSDLESKKHDNIDILDQNPSKKSPLEKNKNEPDSVKNVFENAVEKQEG